jgi:sulfatase modifying factor 1
MVARQAKALIKALWQRIFYRMAAMNSETWSWIERAGWVAGILVLIVTIVGVVHQLGGVKKFVQQFVLVGTVLGLGTGGVVCLGLAARAVDWGRFPGKSPDIPAPPHRAGDSPSPGSVAVAPAPAVKPDVTPAKPAATSKPSPPAIWTNSPGMTFVRIEPGEFTMGSTDAQLARLKELFPTADHNWFKNEQPAHRVRITRPFYLGAHPVTVGQFRRFVERTGYKTEGEKDGKGGVGWDVAKGEWVLDPKYTWRNPGFPQGDDHPVVLVSWNDARAFIEWLNSTDDGSFRYRLPTEAEREYACRAGSTSLFTSKDDDPEKLALIGNVADASHKRAVPVWPTFFRSKADDGHAFTAPVGSYPANPWGLYDTIGNVWEWCEDGFDFEYYKKSPADDPPGEPGESSRVFRGGSWNVQPSDGRPAIRYGDAQKYRSFSLGFRLAAVRAGAVAGASLLQTCTHS